MAEQASVYFAQDIASGWVKIGHSAYPEHRMQALRTQQRKRGFKSPKMVILATFTATTALEQYYHRHFAEDRIEGEWYHPTERLMAFIRHANATRLAMGNCAEAGA